MEWGYNLILSFQCLKIKDQFMQFIEANATYITPNRRLAATLLKEYHSIQLQQKKVSFPTLDILPFNQWLNRLWQEYAIKHLITNKYLLSPDKEHIIWEDILNRSPATHNLLQLSETAEMAKSAWGILKQWQVSFNHPDFSYSEDSSTFQQWAEEFASICLENNWLDYDSLICELCELIAKKMLDLPIKILLIGFSEFTPIQEKLIKSCENAGSQIEINNTYAQQSHSYAQRIRLKDEETEITSMARFAKAIYQKNPQATIGCIVPQLEKMRDPLLAIFSNVFSEKNNFTLNPTLLPFNISAGKKLSSYPIIHTALQLLNLSTQPIDYHAFSQLLHSPFLGDAESEMLNRLRIDYTLCKENNTTLTLKKIDLFKESPHLAARFMKLMQHIEDAKVLYNINQWVDIFMDRLRILGWPGERSLNSHEYQVVQRFLEILNYYRSFNHISPEIQHEHALHYLTYLTSHTIFQPESPEANIQILGLLEAVGLSFDYIWILNMDDTTWPQPVKPNPFIPKQLQKKLNMPHASADRELEYSKRITEQLIFNAKYSIFSHAESNSEGELRESSLISHLPEVSLDQIELSHYQPPAKVIYLSQKLETIIDHQAPIASLIANSHGGVSIIKQQAACPFKAFAEIRLHAKKIELPTLGLTLRNRGNIIHKALELIWLTLQTSEKLSMYSDAALDALLEKNIWQAIEIILKNTTRTRYLILESMYLKTLLHQWLTFEKTRPPFKVIALEYEKKIIIGPMTLSIRIDRMDELADGKQLIIDYKTGRANSIKYWFSDRPEEPQLPIYCLSDADNIIGIAFAETHPDSINLKGMSQYAIEMDSIKPIKEIEYAENRSWETQLLKWQTIILKLSQDFYEGQAAVSPKNRVDTCQHCHLQAFCRINDACI